MALIYEAQLSNTWEHVETGHQTNPRQQSELSIFCGTLSKQDSTSSRTANRIQLLSSLRDTGGLCFMFSLSRSCHHGGFKDRGIVRTHVAPDTEPSFQTPNHSYLIKETMSPNSCSTSAFNSPLGLQEPKWFFKALTHLDWGWSHSRRTCCVHLSQAWAVTSQPRICVMHSSLFSTSILPFRLPGVCMCFPAATKTSSNCFWMKAETSFPCT